MTTVAKFPKIPAELTALVSDGTAEDHGNNTFSRKATP